MSSKLAAVFCNLIGYRLGLGLFVFRQRNVHILLSTFFLGQRITVTSLVAEGAAIQNWYIGILRRPVGVFTNQNNEVMK